MNGFFLSDHTLKFNQNKEDQTALHEWLNETPVHEMQRVCQEAFVNYRSIILQLNSTTFGMKVLEPIHALIRLFNEEGLWIDKNYYPFESIRHFEVKI